MRFGNNGLGAFAVALAALGLASCGGGGGGGGGPQTGVTTPTPPTTPTTPTTPAFVSWSNDLKPGATVTVTGKGQEITYTIGATSIGSISAPSSVGNVTFVETLNANGAPTALQITTPSRTISFSTASGDTIVANGQGILGAVSPDNRSRAAIAAEPIALGWNYQSFGVWQTISGSSGASGAASVGAATPATAVPSTGMATFRGLVSGVYLDTSGADHLVVSAAQVSTNFASRSAAFASNAMTDMVSNQNFAGTELSGNLTYAAGQTALAGTLTTANGRLSGTATGQFYGPAAHEIGGVFILTPTSGSSSLERLGGGFGAKQ